MILTSLQRINYRCNQYFDTCDCDNFIVSLLLDSIKIILSVMLLWIVHNYMGRTSHCETMVIVVDSVDINMYINKCNKLICIAWW